MTMPSGWMPDARHDRRTAFLFDARRDPRHDAQRDAATKNTGRRRTTHRHSHRPRAIAHG
jgi:hypothetical protein